MEAKVRKRSIIKKYFTEEMYIDILKITKIADADNNEKNQLIKDVLIANNVPFNSLGPGTNRMALQIDGYAVKFALDDDGRIDNQREMKYAEALYPYVIKVYECCLNGLILVTEFVEIFNMDDLHRSKDRMKEILSDISSQFLIGDVGITSKNYVNWGKRWNGEICILDFAYIYSVSYSTFKCTCENESLLKYDDNFVNLICPTCGRKYEFKDIRRRITRKAQAEEIGDLKEVGYCIHYDNEEVTKIDKFEPKKDADKKKKKKVNEVKQMNKEHKKMLKKQKKEDPRCFCTF